MRVELLYFDDCPSWRVAEERLVEALARVGRADQRVEHRPITTDEQAQAERFRGSPTILIDDEDPFAGDAPGAFGLTCRVYPSADGFAGSPTVDELVTALTGRA